MMSNLQVGWVGLGNMGTPMSKNLLKAGFNLMVFNRTKEKETPLLKTGAKSAASLQDLAHNSDIIVSMLSNDEAVKQMYLGKEGLITHLSEGKLLVDMSTVSPTTSRLLAENSAKAGVDFIDAPVSGSVKPAEDGTLIIMAGGTQQAYERARPLLDVLGRLSMHLGDTGAGTSAKLAINYLLGLNLQGLAETVLFAKKNGVKTEDMLAIINEGACGNAITKVKSANILNNNFDAAFALKHLAKDIRLAGEQGLNTPLFSPLNQTYQEALQQGLGEEDCIAIFKYLGRKD